MSSGNDEEEAKIDRRASGTRWAILVAIWLPILVATIGATIWFFLFVICG